VGRSFKTRGTKELKRGGTISLKFYWGDLEKKIGVENTGGLHGSMCRPWFEGTRT